MSHSKESCNNLNESEHKNIRTVKSENIICFQAAKDARSISSNSSAVERLLQEAKKLKW